MYNKNQISKLNLIKKINMNIAKIITDLERKTDRDKNKVKRFMKSPR